MNTFPETEKECEHMPHFPDFNAVQPSNPVANDDLNWVRTNHLEWSNGRYATEIGSTHAMFANSDYSEDCDDISGAFNELEESYCDSESVEKIDIDVECQNSSLIDVKAHYPTEEIMSEDIRVISGLPTQPKEAWSASPFVMNTEFLTMFSTPFGEIKVQKENDLGEDRAPTIDSGVDTSDRTDSSLYVTLEGEVALEPKSSEWLSDYHKCECDTNERSDDSLDSEEVFLTGRDGLSIKLYGRHNREKMLDSNRNNCDINPSYQLREETAVETPEPTNCDNLFFSQLPLELTQKVLSYLTQTELTEHVALVCKEWKRLAYDPVHWQHITLHFRQNLETDVFESIITRAPLMKTLCLHGRTDLNVYEMELIGRTCPFLRRLDVGFIPDLNYDIMKSIADYCSNLRALNIEGCARIDDNCIANVAPHLPNICDINLSHCTGLSDESLMVLSKHLLHLEKINIDGITWMSDEGVEILVQYQGEHLTHLDLDGVELSDRAIKAISRCPNLQRLSVSFGELLTGESLLALQDAESLRELRLKKCADIHVDSVHQMFSSKKLSQLTMIDFTECCVIDDGCVILITKCCGDNLKHLALGWCWNITDIGLNAIVSTCRNLEYLDLLGIDKIVGPIFQSLPSQMPKLTYLDLRNCNQIDDDLVMSVVRKKPDLRVINYYGEEVVCISEGHN